MKKLLTTSLISIFLALNSWANTEQLERAIKKSHPQELKQLLGKMTLNEQQKKTYLDLSTEILTIKKKKKSHLAERVKPGEKYTNVGLPLFGTGMMLGMFWGMLSFTDFILYDPLKSRYSLLNKKAHIKFALLEAGILIPGILLCNKGEKELSESNWRSRSREYLDALKVKQYLSNLSD